MAYVSTCVFQCSSFANIFSSSRQFDDKCIAGFKVVTGDLFDLQTSAGACWKGNVLQNMCALSYF